MAGESRLAEQLADAIAAGDFRPGEWLKQVDLATAFGATRFEVRRALEELTLKKSVSHIPQKGYRVSVPSESDVNEARALRVLLESEAARLSVERIDDDGLGRLKVLAETFRHAVYEGTPQERSSANHRFHDTMYSYAGAPLLAELIRDVRDRFRGTPIFFWPSVQSMLKSADDHERIVAALAARDAEGTVTAVRQHILLGPSVLGRAEAALPSSIG